jgi:hypothetical protein
MSRLVVAITGLALAVSLIAPSPAAAGPVTITWQGDNWAWYNYDGFAGCPRSDLASFCEFFYDFSSAFDIPLTSYLVLVETTLSITVQDQLVTDGMILNDAIIRFTAGSLSLSTLGIFDLHTDQFEGLRGLFDSHTEPILGKYLPGLLQMFSASGRPISAPPLANEMLSDYMVRQWYAGHLNTRYEMDFHDGACCDMWGTANVVSISVPELSSLSLALSSLCAMILLRRSLRRTSRRISTEPPLNFNSGRDNPTEKADCYWWELGRGWCRPRLNSPVNWMIEALDKRWVPAPSTLKKSPLVSQASRDWRTLAVALSDSK